MSPELNSVESTNEIKVLSANALKDRLESHGYKTVAEELLKESERQYLAADQKKELATQYFEASQALNDLVNNLRQKASLLRQGKITRQEALSCLTEATKNIIEFPIPRDATPEILEQIANKLEDKAKEYRRKAEDLMEDAEVTKDESLRLKEQANELFEKEFEISELDMKSAISKNIGLKIVFDKLSLFKVDSEFRNQVAYSQNKAQGKIQRGLF